MTQETLKKEVFFLCILKIKILLIYLFLLLPLFLICPKSLLKDAQDAIGEDSIIVSEDEGVDFASFVNKNSKTKIIIPIEDKFFSIGDIFSLFYKEKPDNIIAITGTNGKASSVSFVRQLICSATNIACVAIENKDVIFNKGIIEETINLTTPSSFLLHSIFNNAKIAGANYAVFEASRSWNISGQT